jgi:Zn-dependent protease with chaperone function
MTELHDILPLWVEIGVLTGLPFLWFTLQIGALWLLSRRMPPVVPLHWTERARELTKDIAELKSTSSSMWVVAVITLSVVVRGVLIPGDATVRAIVVALVMIMAGRYFIGVRLRSYRPRRTLSDRWHDSMLGLLQGSPILLITGLMAWFGPAHFGWQALAVHGTGLVLLLLLLLGVGFNIAEVFGSLEKPDDRLSRLIDRVATRSGYRPKMVRVSKSTIAQALALVWRGSLVFTKRLLEVLDDDQVEAIAAHEIGHLRESRQTQVGRLGGLPVILVIGTWRLAVEGMGWFGFAALLALGIFATVRTLAGSRVLESAADEHALEHGGDHDSNQGTERVYAMALERIYEANLSPVNIGSKLSTHPDLYDRMLACGLQPSYPRPDPPRVGTRFRNLVTIPSVVLLALLSLSSFLLSGVADLSPKAASWAIVLGGGRPADIAALGRSLKDTDPERANLLLEFAERHADQQSGPPKMLRPIIDDMVHDLRHTIKGD